MFHKAANYKIWRRQVDWPHQPHYWISLPNRALQTSCIQFPSHMNSPSWRCTMFRENWRCRCVWCLLHSIAAELCRYFETKFMPRWIGRRGPIVSPTGSPNLFPLYFFMWYFVKCYERSAHVQTLSHTQEWIEHAIATVSSETLEKCRKYKFQNQSYQNGKWWTR